MKEFEVVLDKFHYIHWAPKGCGGGRGDYPFISCCVLWFDGVHSSIDWIWAPVSLVMESALTKSQNRCLSGLNSWARSTLFLAWPRGTPRRRQVGLVEQWKCLCLCLCWFLISSRCRVRCAVVVGSLSDLSCKQISPSQVSSGAKFHFIGTKV